MPTTLPEGKSRRVIRFSSLFASMAARKRLSRNVWPVAAARIFLITAVVAAYWASRPNQQPQSAYRPADGPVQKEPGFCDRAGKNPKIGPDADFSILKKMDGKTVEEFRTIASGNPATPVDTALQKKNGKTARLTCPRP